MLDELRKKVAFLSMVTENGGKAMRKIILASTCILVMACNLGRVASTPVQPDPVEQQVSTPMVVQSTGPTAAANSIPSATPPSPD